MPRARERLCLHETAPRAGEGRGTGGRSYGDVGQPNSLSLSGKIQPDGKASLEARGMVGDSRNTVNRLSQGAAYAYRVDAVFEDTRGVGNRTDDVRPCSLTFVK